MMFGHVFDATLSKHRWRQREDRAMGVGKHFVDDAMTGNRGEGRGTVCAKDDEVGLLGAALVEQFFSRVSGNDDGLDGDLIA